MNRLKIHILFASLLFQFCTQMFAGGVVILAEVPQGIQHLVKKMQTITQEQVAAQQSEKKYLFDTGAYSSHLTLAYVAFNELGMPELLAKEPQLDSNLEQFAANNAPIDMSSTLQESQLVIWPGKWEREFAGNKYKNYSILALKLRPSAQLMALVDALDKTLEKHPVSVKRENPFGAHVTIGWIYDEKDINATPMAEAVKPLLEKCVKELNPEKNFMIEAFKLSTADKAQKIFSLAKK